MLPYSRLIVLWTILVLWTLVFATSATSNLTDLADKSSIRTENELSNLKQQLNQESSIRLALMNQLYTLNSDMITVKQRMDSISREGRQFEDQLEEMQRKVQSLETENQNLRTEPRPVSNQVMSNATGQMVGNGSPLVPTTTSQDQVVAFSAYLSNTLLFQNRSTDVIYDTAVLNTNNVYNSKTGYFTAPSSGLYVFSWASMVHAETVFNAELLVNGERRGLGNCNNYLGSGIENCSNTVPVILVAGDRVNIRTVNANYLQGYRWSSFQGWKVR